MGVLDGKVAPPGIGRGTPSSDCHARRSEPPDGKGNRVGQGELREAATTGRSRKNHGHGRLHAAPPFPGADRDESSSARRAFCDGNSSYPLLGFIRGCLRSSRSLV
jgi:hypothetical protein